MSSVYYMNCYTGMSSRVSAPSDRADQDLAREGAARLYEDHHILHRATKLAVTNPSTSVLRLGICKERSDAARRLTVGRNLHRARIVVFYALSGLLAIFLTFELFAHFLAPTPVVTNWSGGHHVHSIAHAVLTAVLIAAAALGLHPRTRRIAGLQALLLVNVLGLLVSVIAWQGFHNLAFPVFNFTLYGVIAVIVATVHPDRGRLFARGDVDPRLAVIAVLAFVPMIVYAAIEVSKQLSNAEPVHAAVGHFALMGALAVALSGLAGLAALRTEGWRLPLWSVGLAVPALGVASIAFASEASSLGLVGGVLAIAWGAIFIWAGNRREVAPVR
jgi:hypothetical protein